MSSYEKKTAPRAARTATTDHKQGSKSPKHRGYRAPVDEPTRGKGGSGRGGPKKRWSADDRAKRSAGGSDRARGQGRDGAQGRDGGARPARDDRRPDWQPRTQRPARAPYGKTNERDGHRGHDNRSQDNRGQGYQGNQGYQGKGAPERAGRPARDDRGAPERGGRFDRTDRTERPAKFDRAERPARNDRSDRSSYADRNARTEPRNSRVEPRSSRVEPVETRGRYSRDTAERPAYGDKRGFRDNRPARDDRAGRGGRGGTDARPNHDTRPNRDDRPAREHRPARDNQSFRDDRPRRESDFYPKRDDAQKKYTGHEDVVLERLEADAIQASDVVGVTFGDLGLGANIVRELSVLGAESPFPIQAATIPDVLKGMDVLGRGKTGSGKTIAFGAPLVERLLENNGAKARKPGRRPRALILAPTRELALQIDRTIQPIARSVGIFTTQIYGGVPQHRQVQALQRGVDIVIGTPGRIEDLIDQGRLDLSDVKITVLDEADHMCDLGFLEPVQRILKETAPDGQRLLFSATLDKGVATLVDEFLVNPSVHEVAGEDQASSTIDHRVLLIEQSDKRAIIEQLASGDGKTLIFARTRAFAEQLADDLDNAGIPAVSLHGDLNQARRTRNLEKLTSGRVNVLVATDVAARGIHVDDISLVIQADPPDEYKSYLHRAGRTGRAGKPGTVVTLVNTRRKRKMDELLGRAEISPRFDQVRPGDALLGKLAAL